MDTWWWGHDDRDTIETRCERRPHPPDTHAPYIYSKHPKPKAHLLDDRHLRFGLGPQQVKLARGRVVRLALPLVARAADQQIVAPKEAAPQRPLCSCCCCCWPPLQLLLKALQRGGRRQGCGRQEAHGRLREHEEAHEAHNTPHCHCWGGRMGSGSGQWMGKGRDGRAEGSRTIHRIRMMMRGWLGHPKGSRGLI